MVVNNREINPVGSIAKKATDKSAGLLEEACPNTAEQLKTGELGERPGGANEALTHAGAKAQKLFDLAGFLTPIPRQRKSSPRKMREDPCDQPGRNGKLPIALREERIQLFTELHRFKELKFA